MKCASLRNKGFIYCPNFKKLLVLIVAIMTLNGLAFSQKEFENDQVHIEVQVYSGIYEYEVINKANDRITRFEIPEHGCYDPKVPEGWESEMSGGFFKAWAKFSTYGIEPKEVGRFSLRVSSEGAFLGKAPAIIQFESGQVTEISGVWAPIKEPKYRVVLITLTLFVIVLFQIVIMIGKSRRKKKSLISDV